MDNDFQDIKIQLSSQRLQIPHSCNVSSFKKLVPYISSFALRELEKQDEIVKFGTINLLCSGQFIAIMGLLCAQKILELKKELILLNLIHLQWMINMRTCNSCYCSLSSEKDNIHWSSSIKHAFSSTRKYLRDHFSTS